MKHTPLGMFGVRLSVLRPRPQLAVFTVQSIIVVFMFRVTPWKREQAVHTESLL